MISSSDSSTTQSGWNCLNNIPSRVFGWLYGKLVRIAKAIKYIFSGGSTGESASQPVLRPVVERTISRASDDQTQHDSFLRRPASVETTPSASDASHEGPSPHRELELYNRANRRLPGFTGVELQRICWGDVRSVLNDIVALIVQVNELNIFKYNEALRIYSQTVAFLNQAEFNDFGFLMLAISLEVNDSYIEKWREMDPLEKINLVVNTNSKNCKLANQCLLKTKYFINKIRKMVLPRYKNYSSALFFKYRKNSTQPASEPEIRGLQKGVEGIEAVLTEFTKGKIGEQIAHDSILQSRLSNIIEKLQDLIRFLQIR